MTTKPPPKPVRPRSQPLRLWCVEYVCDGVMGKVNGGCVCVATVEALTATLALERFDMDYPNVKVVGVY